MILIFCKRNSQRLTYSFNLLFNTLLGMEWEYTDNADAFRECQGAKVCYGSEPLTGKEVFIRADGLLFETGIRHSVPPVSERAGCQVLFPDTEGQCHAGYDLFSAAFFLVSRYEEYLPHVKDRFGRFEASESLAFKNGFLHRPVVDIYAWHLKKLLSERFPGLIFPERTFRFIPTIDIDIAFAYKGRGLIRTMYGAARSLLTGDFGRLSERVGVLSGKTPDPYDTYGDQMMLHAKYRSSPYYFFLCGDHGPLDKNISYLSASFKKLVREMARHATIGIHPSFASDSKPRILNKEMKRLAELSNKPVTCSRQHFLKLQLPHTYRALIANNITHDFSMGYASRPGFRSGTCTPFYFYDLERETATSLKVVPLTVMDGTLRDYLGLSPGQAIQTIRELMDEVKGVNGTFVSLWHNDAFSEKGSWAGWKKVYEEMLKMMSIMG